MKTANTILRLIFTATLLGMVINVAMGTKAVANDADRLGRDLTPLGGDVAGNEAGTIPPWDGGITVPPVDYRPGDRHLDPYPEDEVLFTIEVSNMDSHRDQLSVGHQRMLEKYPTFKMPIYPTRRSASAPQYIYDATHDLVDRATLEKGGNGINNAVIGIPFPIPQSGIEVIWNHVLRYRGQSIVARLEGATVTSSGDYYITKDDVKVLFRYSLPNMTLDDLGNVMLLFKSKSVGGPQAGEMILVHETINQKQEPRNAWTYTRGDRRVRRAPNLAYDNSRSGGMRTVDQLDMYNGAPDRYNWTLVGKREIYVPYNSYKLHSNQLSYSDILTPKHPNSDHLRYELHRVWVVEGNLKEGESHIYKRRVFYVDEDSWNILLVDIYDKKNNLYRVQEAHVINYYDALVFMPTVEIYFDLSLKQYLASGLSNEAQTRVFNRPLSPREFTPQALRREGR